MMLRTFVILFFAVCALWTFGETSSCYDCGRYCIKACGTRNFRPCCYNNNMRKRQSAFDVGSWTQPQRFAIPLQPAYGDEGDEDVEE